MTIPDITITSADAELLAETLEARAAAIRTEADELAEFRATRDEYEAACLRRDAARQRQALYEMARDGMRAIRCADEAARWDAASAKALAAHHEAQGAAPGYDEED